MNEADWLTSVDSREMMEFLRGKASERKLRLFACACARLVWGMLPQGLLREAVEAGEQYADDLISDERRQEFIHRLFAPWGQSERPSNWFGGRPWSEVNWDEWAPFFAAKLTVVPGATLAKLPDGLSWDRIACLTGPSQPNLLRDIFGPAPQAPAMFFPVWRTSDSVTLAEYIYEDKAFSSLPALGEALEAAGCYDSTILAHCRNEGPHVRGCWVVDAVLGKK